MSNASMKFDGKLIDELSKSIPSTLFALNELIKNAYDAFSTEVIIRIEPSKNLISISDKGCGMGVTEVENLFHISRSSKIYGQVIEKDGVKRITQGSKGLGFLAAFKFGDLVEWDTCKDGTRLSFSVRKSTLTSKKDLTGTQIPYKTSECSTNGTTIRITANKHELDTLINDLKDIRIAEKLVATIKDDSFNIRLEIENKNKALTTRSLVKATNEKEEWQLFYVTYNATEGKVEFYNRGNYLASFPFELRRTDYSIDLELVLFHFGNGRSANPISDLYKRVRDGALYPLVYINDNLFNNTEIFDPDILRKKSSGKTLAQMIGAVRIISESKYIEFNSDRTNFVDNGFIRDLCKDLYDLNSLIQREGSTLKKSLEKQASRISSLLGKASPTSNAGGAKSVTATVMLDRQKKQLFYVPSEQINLEEYIYQIRNSEGKEVNKNEVSIIVDGEISDTKVLPSVKDVCQKYITFNFVDPSTGLAMSDVTLSFEKRVSSITGARVDDKKSLFNIQAASDYNVSLDTVSAIIHAIDKAYSSKSRDDYMPLIACSIRAIFEICADKLLKKHKTWFQNFDKSKFDTSTKKELNDKLLQDVLHVIVLVKETPNLMQNISEETDIGYSTLRNLLNLRDFKEGVKHSHVGAHQSMRYLTKGKILDCAATCGYFAVICDVLVNADKNTLPNVTKITEAIFEQYIKSIR